MVDGDPVCLQAQQGREDMDSERKGGPKEEREREEEQFYSPFGGNRA